MADALGQIGFIVEMTGHYAKAEGYYQEALPIFHEFGDRFHISEYTSRLGELAFLKGEFGRARELVTEGLALARQSNLLLSILWNQAQLGFIFNAEDGEK